MRRSSDRIWRYWISDVEHSCSARDSSTQKTKAVRPQPADDPRIVVLQLYFISEEQILLGQIGPADEATSVLFPCYHAVETAREATVSESQGFLCTDSDRSVRFARTAPAGTSRCLSLGEACILLVEPFQAFNSTFQTRLGMSGVLNFSLGLTLSLTNFLNPCLETI